MTTRTSKIRWSHKS